MSKKVFIPRNKLRLLNDNKGDLVTQDEYKLDTGTGLEYGHVVDESIIQEITSD